jgi:adenylate cyclase
VHLFTTRPARCASSYLYVFTVFLEKILYNSASTIVETEENRVVASTDWVTRTGRDLRKIEMLLSNLSRQLHEQIRRLETSVEGKYANEAADPRVQMLNEALRIHRMVDQQLAQLNLDMHRLVQHLRKRFNTSAEVISSSAFPAVNGLSQFEDEREELTNSISYLQQEQTELKTLHEIARTLNSTLEFDEVLRLVMDRVISFVSAERGFLMLVNPETHELEFAIARDKNARPIEESVFDTAPISRNTIKRVIRTGQPVLTDDTQADDALRAQESILAYSIRSIMCAPLIVRDHCIGAVYVDCRFTAKLFEPRHRDTLLAFCNQAAIAIDNARLFADLNRAIQQVKEDKQYMDNIFGSIANGVITTDSAGCITTFNDAAAFILGLRPEDVKGKLYQEAFAVLPQTRLGELLGEAHAKHELGTLVNREITCSIPSREHEGTVYLNCYVSSLRDTDGSHIGMALVIDDRTDLKRSEARAREIRRIFEQYVHPKVVQQLTQDPSALNLGGETKEISVVFADIRGYTRLSESMLPDEVMHLINRYLKIMCDAIWEEEGTLTAFQGDALMAIFNAPLPQPHHALHAVRAAWKMRMAVLDYQRSLPQETRVSFGIGVNTGLATVGNVGAPQRLQNYTAIGDVINVASRLQSNASDNDIFLNDSTYAQVYRYSQVGPPFALPVKNKSTPLIARKLIGLI